MHLKFMVIFAAITGLAAVTGCSKEKEEEVEEFAIPAVSASCATPATTCADNSANGKNMMIYWSNKICAESSSAAQIKAGNNAVATCSEGVCTATISTWFDFDGNPVTKLEEGSYFLCAGVDLDGSEDLGQAGEPVAVKTGVKIEDGAAAQTISDFVDQE